MAVEGQRTALVVLAVPGDEARVAGYTAADGPPPVGPAADEVQKWFTDKGFDVDPVVGISFSISGPEQLFDRTFAGTPVFGRAAEPGGELDQAALRGRLDAAVLPYVAAVVVGPPPAFGPGNV